MWISSLAPSPMIWTPSSCARVRVEDQLQQPGAVADDLAAGDLAILRLADLVGHALLGQLLLVLPDHRDLGDGVDAVGEELRDALASTPKAWQAARRPCSMEVEARLGKPITSPTA